MCTKAAAIAPCGSTQINENFNHMVASKSPKSQHYSSPGSLKPRVSAVVAQKNVCSTYLSQACEKNRISPGKFDYKFATSADKTWKWQNTYKSSKVYNRQNLRKQDSSKHLNWGKKILTRLKLTTRWLLQNLTLRKSHSLVELSQ